MATKKKAAKKAPAKKKKGTHMSSITGKYVTSAYAAKHPNTTFEVNRRKKK